MISPGAEVEVPVEVRFPVPGSKTSMLSVTLFESSEVSLKSIC